MNRSSLHSTLAGAALGLTWGSGFRAWMIGIAGPASTFTWSGTFAGILLPATLVGAALGWSENARRTGGPDVRRWVALTPLLFVIAPALVQADFVAQLRSGLGTGAIATALIGMLGGYAIAGRGPRWAVGVTRLILAALVIAAITGSFLASTDPRLRATTPSGAFSVLTFIAFAGVLAWACAIPHRGMPSPS